MKHTLYVTMIMVLVVCAGCEGPEGPTGAKGKDGNANVHVKFYTASSSDWQINGTACSIQLTDADITQDIVDNGAVLVYMKTSTSDWELLPVTDYLTSSSILIFSTVYDVNTVGVFVTNNSGSALRPSFSVNFKFIAIASLAKAANAEINWNNYNEVKQRFNLSE